MNRTIKLGAIALLSTLFANTVNAAPVYASDKARSVVEKLVAAHGGYERWLEAPSFQFTALMYLAVLPLGDERTAYDNWRYYTVTIEPRTSRAYVDIPLEANAGPELAYNGEDSWVVPYTFDQPRYRDAPPMLLWLHYGMIALPFLTQVDGVKLEYLGQESILNNETEFDVVRMTFDPEGKIHEGKIDLFVDPETSRLKAWKQGTRLPLLPGNVLPKEFRTGNWATLRVIDEYVEFDGLIVARGYSSFDEKTGDVTGAHLILNPTLQHKFDEDALRRPDNGIPHPIFRSRTQ